jgi:thioesterase domain-containing protein/acyl carrier protein
VLDKAMRPVPPGIAGELYIGGHGVARGYHNQQELTAKRFVVNPFEPSERLYRTGDVASYLPDGRLLHLGRADLQVKIRGFRIELGEIEAQLGHHPAISSVVVAARDDANSMKQLVAYATLNDGHRQPELAEMREFVRVALPEYMVPTQFVFLDALPLTANKKVDRAALPAPSPASASGRASPEDQPRGRLEVQLAALWRGVLANEDIGVHDNFFDHGGHSLKAVQLVAEIESVMGQQLPLAAFFQAPSIREMARLLERSHPLRRGSLVAIKRGGEAVPIFAVPGVGGHVLMFGKLARTLPIDRPFYGLQARGLDGPEKPLTSIRGMAEKYVEEIRAVRPHGPYIIAGACTGGVTAYEMARQLRAAGETAVLMLWESWHPSSARRRLVGGQVLSPLDAIFAKVVERDTRSRVARATWHAVSHYEPKPIQGSLLHVIAENRDVRPDVVDTRRLWETLTQEPAQVEFNPATDSGQLFVSPNVERLVAQIESYAESQLR